MHTLGYMNHTETKIFYIIFILSQCCGRKELNIPPKYPNAKNISELFYEGFEKDLLIK